MKGNILIVDDNEEILFSLEILLEKHFNKISCIKTPNLIESELASNDYNAVILDMNFTASIKSGNEGIFWLKKILGYDKTISVIFITAFPGIELAVKAIKEGATDFIEKPWSNEKLLTTIKNAVKICSKEKEINRLEHTEKTMLYSKPEILFEEFKSPIMQKVLSTINKVAQTDANILILGENGTGKEIVAKKIHSLSHRKSKSFIKVDLGALPETLFESELFGHSAGAFTDAKKSKAGRIELAHEGTLFLDEIGNLPIHQQSKLLSAIQEKKTFRIGSVKPTPINFRLISATNQPLYKLTEQKKFREDLLYRINTVQIDLPPLRERISDIPIFVQYFINKFNKKYKRKIGIQKQALTHLKEFAWPGNIRQLEHTIENSIIMCEGDILYKENFNLSTTEKPKGIRLNYYDNEKVLIENALSKCEGNLSKASDMLGIARTTLYRKIKKYDL